MITIDLRSSWPSSKLYARWIWERLFREVHAEHFTSLHDFLCDLEIMAELIEKNKFPFYWYSDKSGYTDLTTYKPINRTGEVVYKVDLSDNQNSIVIIGENY